LSAAYVSGITSPHRTPLHALTWLVWAVAAAASVQLAPNPAYVVVVVLAAAVVVEAHADDGPLASGFPLLVSVGVVFALLRVVLTALTTHGTGDTLFTIPEATLPTLLGGFTLGGPIQTAVVLRTAAEGLAIVGILAAFGAFNAVVSHAELLQAAPRAFHEIGLIVTVAIAFVPSTIAAASAAREADRARTGGRVVRRGRLLRQLVPILETGMERAVSLSESMDSRGFGHLTPTRAEGRAAWLGGAGLLALACAFVALVGRAPSTALGLAVAGACAVVAAAGIASRASRRTRYRPRRLAARDLTVLAVTVAAPAALAVLAVIGADDLAWVPRSVRLPPVSPLPLVALAALTAPALVRT
jgi:energy-coupling factor transport system permease protein